MRRYWQSRTLVERIRLLRFVLPLVLIPIVVIYQLQIAVRLEEAYGHPVHYAAEISFYSLLGPVVTWVTLIWVERRLMEKEALEQKFRARTQQLAGLTAASPDAIMSLDSGGRILSWNQGAERLFGYQADDIIGHPISEILPETGESSNLLLRTKALQRFETNAVNLDGYTTRVDVTLTHLDQEQPDSPVSLLILRDITVRSERAAILEEERKRISRDLHDGVAQSVYFMALKADMTLEQMETDPEAAKVNLKEISGKSRGVIQDVRRAIFGLRPLEWSEEGFIPALETFIENFAEQADWQTELQLQTENGEIPPRLKPTVFRLVQESLTNVAKHARATQVNVRLEQFGSPKSIALSIADNGLGFIESEVSYGLGIRQMQQRVETVGGRLQVESTPDLGTTMRFVIPLSRRRDG